MHVVHIISGLTRGGAEMVMLSVVKALSDAGSTSTILSLTNEGELGAELLKIPGVKLRCLHLQRGIFSISSLPRLARAIRKENPDLIQTWMYHSDLLGGLANLLSRRAPLLWGVHSSETAKLSTQLVVRACALTSRILPSKIVFCGEFSMARHQKAGYARDRCVLIPNGIDTDLMKPSPQARAFFRQQLGIPDSAIVVGHIARWNPLKDHATFLKAIDLTQEKQPHIHAVMVGRGIDLHNPNFKQLFQACRFPERIHLIGAQSDTQKIYPGFDTFCVSSTAESFPMVLIEAMSCGVPCVSTQVGDCVNIIGGTGETCEPSSPSALSEALLRMAERVSKNPQQLSEQTRTRALEKFKLIDSTSKYLELYKSVAAENMKEKD